MRSGWIVAIVMVLLVLNQSVQAGGPFVYADNGTIVKWASSGGSTSVTLTLDQGKLGLLTNVQANALVANVIGVWNGISQSTVNLTISPTPLSQDIDETNYYPVLRSGFPHGYNPVVYDEDGALIDALYGTGMRNQILGFAGPVYSTDSHVPPHPLPGNFVEGQVVLNGRMLDGVDTGASNPEVTQSEFEGVIVHEAGHLLGLDHSQINVLDPTNNDQPTMFPIFYGGTAVRSPAPDDIGWISYLYPSAQYSSSFGNITGQIIQRVGATDSGYQGINVVARRVGGARVDAISCVSGYVYCAGYGPIGFSGFYLMPGVPPGNYTVEVERILPAFTGGSSVGPVDPPVGFPGIAGPEFYSGLLESAYDNPAEKAEIPVSVGSETGNIGIILNTEIAPADAPRWLLYR